MSSQNLGFSWKRLVFGGLDAGTIRRNHFQGVAAEDAMHQHAEAVAIEIDAIITDAKAVQDVAVALELAEVFEFAGDDMLGEAAKIAEDLQLEFLGHAREFRRAGRRENDLKRVHLQYQKI